jgi:hypothetical protein
VTRVPADPLNRRDRVIAVSEFDAVGYLHDALELARWTATDLWIGVLSMGGGFSRADIDDLLSGASPLSEQVYNLLAAALNDRFVDLGLDHPVRYADELMRD